LTWKVSVGRKKGDQAGRGVQKQRRNQPKKVGDVAVEKSKNVQRNSAERRAVGKKMSEREGILALRVRKKGLR